MSILNKIGGYIVEFVIWIVAIILGLFVFAAHEVLRLWDK